MLEKVLALLVVSSLGVGVVRRYLSLNRLWVRRKDRVVAESISIYALLLGLATSTPFLLKNVFRADYQGTANELMSMAVAVFQLLVGVGFWLPGQRASLAARLAAALSLERRESGDLVKRLVRPQAAPTIVRILHQLASIDARVDEEERAYIARFASAWGIDYRPERVERAGDAGYAALWRSVVEYLGSGPPKREAHELCAVMKKLADLDGVESEEEKLALAELLGQLETYASGAAEIRYHVAIVPQSAAQETAILELTPEARKVKRAGGDVYVVESHFSAAFAEVMCKKYRSLSLLTLVLPDADDVPGAEAA